MSSPLVREYCPGCAAATFYVIHEGEPHRYCNGCSAADRRARSTLQLLSRFALWMWLEAAYRQSKGKRGKWGRHRLRSELLISALHGGLLRVTWSQP